VLREEVTTDDFSIGIALTSFASLRMTGFGKLREDGRWKA
jgi:hypothetical protein